MLTAILLGLLLTAGLAPWLAKRLRGATGLVLALVPASAFVAFLTLIPQVSSGAVLLEAHSWVPMLGIDLSFRVDGLALLFLIVISGIGALILIYAEGYLHGHAQIGRFYASLILFMASMLGVVASDNIILIFIFWEMTSVSSYLLIGFYHEDKASRASALQALLITCAGGQALVAGLVLLGMVSGTFSLGTILADGEMVKESPLYPVILTLILLGAFTKSAQFPFHFWLPGAMSAPAPVSAYLHSATMVNAGVFLLARLAPSLGGTPAWHYAAGGVGFVTMVLGAVFAWPQTDLKRLLAWSTVSALGMMTLLLGIGTNLAVKAAMLLFLVHALYKGALFMVAGTVDHETGTRDVRKLSGLMRAMPMTGIAAGVAALSMCGLPPLLGFISKELLYEAQLQVPFLGAWVIAGGVLASVIMVSAALTVGIRPFFGACTAAFAKVHEASWLLWIGPLVLAFGGLVLGLFPALIGDSLIGPATAAVRMEKNVGYLKLWHGWNTVLVLSMVTVVLGFLAFRVRVTGRAIAGKVSFLTGFGPEKGYEKLVESLTIFGTWQTNTIQHGRLRGYVCMVLVVMIVGTLATLALHGLRVPGPADFQGARFYEIIICIAMLVSGICAVQAQSRLVAVALLSVLGYGVAIIFALHGAPDLAITQFLVETLTLILLVLAAYHLPKFGDLSSKLRRRSDAILAGVGGVVMTLLVFVALDVQTHESISHYFSEQSFSAHGRNVVNVILVDFRALDTLGEITVLAAAALGVAALFGLSRKREGKES